MSLTQGLQPPRLVEVTRSSYDRLFATGEIYTLGVASCIAVSAYDEASQSAYLGHFDPASLTGKENTLTAMVESAEHTFRHSEGIRLWISGGSLMRSFGASYGFQHTEDVQIANEQTILSRERVVSGIGSLAAMAKTIDIAWLPPDNSIGYHLDVESGHTAIHHE